ncbi:MAG: CPBP family intramembrane metalloprotease [Bacteroidales bacterium]|nr:CPBP family intramembrane metalloprotease [Bacteroidales bacterium]
MKNIPDWKEIDLDLYIYVFIVTVAFSAYYFLSNSDTLKKRFIQKTGIEKIKIYWVLFEKLLGFLFFGVIPLTFVLVVFNESLLTCGISAENFQISLYWIIGLSPILILLSYFNSKKKDNLNRYPQIRTSKWSLQLLVISALSWILYLLAYEFMFRGFLLFVSERNLGFWAAIILNIVVYSLAHIPKGIKETVGAIPFGFVLCIITLQTGNIFATFVLHAVLALSNEWFSLKANSEMSFIKKC